MNQMVAFKIFKHYPKGIIVIPIEDDEIGRWNAAIYRLYPDGSLGDTLFELDHYQNKSREGAISELNYVLKRAMLTVTAMAN